VPVCSSVALVLAVRLRASGRLCAREVIFPAAAEVGCWTLDGLVLAFAVATWVVAVLTFTALLAANVTAFARENSEVLPPGSVAVAVATWPAATATGSEAMKLALPL